MPELLGTMRSPAVRSLPSRDSRRPPARYEPIDFVKPPRAIPLPTRQLRRPLGYGTSRHIVIAQTTLVHPITKERLDESGLFVMRRGEFLCMVKGTLRVGRSKACTHSMQITQEAFVVRLLPRTQATLAASHRSHARSRDAV